MPCGLGVRRQSSELCLELLIAEEALMGLLLFILQAGREGTTAYHYAALDVVGEDGVYPL